ncbi:MAG: V-type ATP synthase subunit I [Pirellulaceae bacterium]|nr:V-type ATP synthase subunit I [Pirellulaceae bacterium]
MAIVKLKKVTLYGMSSQRDSVLDGLQQMGCLHLIDLPGHGGKPLDSAERQQVHEAIGYLQSCAIQNSNQLTEYPHHQNCLAVARDALENQQRRDALDDEREQLLRAIELVEPWGEFRLPDLSQTHDLRLWFYALPRRQLNVLDSLNLPWQRISEDQQFIYVVVVSPSEPSLPLSRVSLDSRPLSELRERLAAVDEELEKLQWDRAALTRSLSLLQRDLAATDNQIAHAEAVLRVAQDDHVFALQGWAPQTALEALRDYARRNHLALTEAAPGPDEQPPTLLKNPAVVAGAEGAVTFYMTPAYQAWDPTWIMYGSFTLFFAMIMSDAAYGAILALGLAFVWPRLSGTKQLRHTRLLLLSLVVASIVYGVAAGSYFGATPAALERFQLKLDGQPLAGNKTAMMLIALGIGIAHLGLANIITFIRGVGTSQALCPLGWAVALIGGYCMGVFSQPDNPGAIWTGQLLGRTPESFQPLVKQLGMYGLIGGMGLVFLFSSSRPFFSARPADWLWRVLDGFMGLTKISQAFGDTLSYLRLFALGLASAQLAVTFNDLAIGVKNMPGLGILLAGLILIIGHAVNIVLGIMSGVVHGLRLNCIEFFNWSLTEEGYPFKPFNKKVG